jgi:hypothetical protein
MFDSPGGPKKFQKVIAKSKMLNLKEKGGAGAVSNRSGSRPAFLFCSFIFSF